MGKASSSTSQSQGVGMNAIVQNPRGQEEKPYQGTIRKDRGRARSKSTEYARPLGMSNRRQSTGSTYDQRSTWTSENVRRHDAEHSNRGRSRERSQNRGESVPRSIASRADAKSVYSMSTESVRSRSRERPVKNTQRERYQRSDWRNEHPMKAVECSACGKRHPGGARECQFIQANHPDANRSSIPWKESETFKRLQSVSQSIKSLEYGRKLRLMGEDIWALVNTTQGPRKPDKYDRKVSVEDIIVLPDSQLHEIIDLNVICSENEDSEEIQARKYSSKDTSETDAPYTRIDKKRLTLLLDSGCIGRDFISITCVQKLKLNTYSIMYPIDVISIHGNEIATQVVCINNFEINYKDQQIIIPEVNLVVINKAPTDIILGHGSLKMYNVYSRLSRYFGAAHSD